MIDMREIIRRQEEEFHRRGRQSEKVPVRRILATIRLQLDIMRAPAIIMIEKAMNHHIHTDLEGMMKLKGQMSVLETGAIREPLYLVAGPILPHINVNELLLKL